MKVISLEAPRALEDTIRTVRHGGVIAFPTDTVYGIGASLNHPDALARIYTIKGRDAAKPLPVLLSSIDRIELVAGTPNPRVRALLREFWPGALTVALAAKPGMPREIIHADGTVGVRIPDHSIALTICERAGGALATTSANRSGEPPARSVEDLTGQIQDGIDVVLNGGFSPSREPSTVIRVENARIAVIRAGAIAPERIHAAWSRITQEADAR